MSDLDARGEPPDPGQDDTADDFDEEIGWDTSEADAAEQHRTPGDDSFRWAREQEAAERVPAEVDPADHADQVRSIGGDDDDYR